MSASHNVLSHDEQIALTLTAALIQAKSDGNVPDVDLQKAYRSYKRLHDMIADSPESRARRGFPQ
jgi:hypothetical protein